jgi:hypothetical protein
MPALLRANIDRYRPFRDRTRLQSLSLLVLAPFQHIHGVGYVLVVHSLHTFSQLPRKSFTGLPFSRVNK